MNKINTKNLSTFVAAMQRLPSSVRKQEVDLSAANKPDGKTPSGHEGLVFIVAESIPALKKLQQYHQSQVSDDLGSYTCFTNVLALSEYLGFKHTDADQGLLEWADEHPKTWGSDYGELMFSAPEAFMTPADFVEVRLALKSPKNVLLTIQDLIDWWSWVLHRALEQEHKL